MIHSVMMEWLIPCNAYDCYDANQQNPMVLQISPIGRMHNIANIFVKNSLVGYTIWMGININILNSAKFKYIYIFKTRYKCCAQHTGRVANPIVWGGTKGMKCQGCNPFHRVIYTYYVKWVFASVYTVCTIESVNHTNHVDELDRALPTCV